MLLRLIQLQLQLHKYKRWPENRHDNDALFFGYTD